MWNKTELWFPQAIKFPKKLTWHAEQSFFFYRIAPHDKQITKIPDGCKNVYGLYTWLIYQFEHNNFARKKCTWDAFVGHSLAIFLRFNTKIFLCLHSLITWEGVIMGKLLSLFYLHVTWWCLDSFFEGDPFIFMKFLRGRPIFFRA